MLYASTESDTFGACWLAILAITIPGGHPDASRLDSRRFETLVLTSWAGRDRRIDAAATAAVASGRRAANQRQEVRHLVLAVGRSESHRHVGPKAERSARNPQPVRHDRHELAGSQLHRTSAAAGFDRPQTLDHPLGRLQRQQSHSDHDASRQPAGASHQRRSRWSRLSVDGIAWRPSSAVRTIPTCRRSSGWPTRGSPMSGNRATWAASTLP